MWVGETCQIYFSQIKPDNYHTHYTLFIPKNTNSSIFSKY